jgi:hypothetical protein
MPANRLRSSLDTPNPKNKTNEVSTCVIYKP